jgi:predicted  nucleic acid-binding Zn ribbon protein
MYVVELEFVRTGPLDEAGRDERAVEAIVELLNALRMNGQVCGAEFPLAERPGRYLSNVLIPEAGALAAERHNTYVRRGLGEAHAAGLTGPRVTVLGEDPASAGVCGCPAPSSYILYTEHHTLESPLRCGDCFGPVPLYRVPPTADGEYHDVMAWQSDYRACDRLQMNDRTSVRAALRQLQRVDSELSAQGLAVRDNIESSTGTPAFHYLYRHGARSLAAELERRCPVCGEAWLLEAPWHGRFDYRCNRDRLLSNIAWDVRHRSGREGSE